MHPGCAPTVPLRAGGLSPRADISLVVHVTALQSAQFYKCAGEMKGAWNSDWRASSEELLTSSCHRQRGGGGREGGRKKQREEKIYSFIVSLCLGFPTYEFIIWCSENQINKSLGNTWLGKRVGVGIGKEGEKR